MLWADEAETAVLAKNILRYGVPLANDGKNFLGIFPPYHIEVNKDFIWTWSPWLAPYVTAASFKLLGPTTFAARLPFALIAFAAVLLIRKVAMALYSDKATATVASVLLAMCVPFLLHSRQCRYYAVLTFTQLWILFGYERMRSGEGRTGGMHLTLAMIAQFYSNYVSFAGNCIALLAQTLFIKPREKRLFLRLITCGAVCAAAISPWIIYSGMLERSKFMGVTRAWRAFAFYVSETNFHVVPLVMLCVPVALYVWKRRGGGDAGWSAGTSLLILSVLGQLAVLVFFSQIYFRYLMAPLPALILLESRALTWSFRRQWVRYAILALLILTNWPGIVSMMPVRGTHAFGSPLLLYAREITSDYEDELENVVDFFLANGDSSESIFVMDEESPLIFYADMKIIDGRFPENADKMREATWVLTDSPSAVVYHPPWMLNVSPADLPGYEVCWLKVRNTIHGASRPGPDQHQALTADTFKAIAVYRRVH